MEQLFYPLKNYIEQTKPDQLQIPEERKEILKMLASYIQQCRQTSAPAKLVFICTHNSRRSHISQIWAQVAAYYYGIENLLSYSGGTEATAFNPRAVKAMQKTGMKILVTNDGENPLYQVSFAEGKNIQAFSKRYDDAGNPSDNFAAIMTCSHADENCPIIHGATVRIPLTYDDPKDFDGTPLEEIKYDERVKQIGTEILYAFSLVK